MSERVLITCQQMQECIDTFRPSFEERGIELVMPAIERQQLNEDELISLMEDVDGIIAGDDTFNARVLSHAPRLRVIVKWGVGIDGIDVDAAERRGISVTNTPGVFANDVADVVAGYLVMLARQLHRVHASIVDGGWLKIRGTTLADSDLGILGFGNVGRSVADHGKAFGMTVRTHDVSTDAADAAEALDVQLVPRDQLFSESQFLVLCAPLTAATRHAVNAETLALMPHGSSIVNVSRGGLIEEAALVEALAHGQIAAAALDVFEEEPLPANSGLRAFPQCVFGSHNASNTEQGTLRASAQAVLNVLRGLGHDVTA